MTCINDPQQGVGVSSFNTCLLPPPSPRPTPTTADVARHRPYEDLQALLTGTLFVALGVIMFNQAGLLTGGTVGVALLAHYASGMDFAPAYFLVNLPFYALAWMRMGAAFTVKTFAPSRCCRCWRTCCRWVWCSSIFRRCWPPSSAACCAAPAC